MKQESLSKERLYVVILLPFNVGFHLHWIVHNLQYLAIMFLEIK